MALITSLIAPVETMVLFNFGSRGSSVAITPLTFGSNAELSLSRSAAEIFNERITLAVSAVRCSEAASSTFSAFLPFTSKVVTASLVVLDG